MNDSIFSPNVLTALLVTIGAASATMLGALVLLKTKETNPRLLSFGLSFAGGAMVYISLIEIFWKSQDSFKEIFTAKDAYNYTTISFFAGMLLLFLLDKLIPNPHNDLSIPSHINDEGKAKLQKLGILAALAITAHNIPEGMATFFSTLENPTVGLSLSIAIAVHNIPEGISIVIPVFYATNSKKKALIACLISALAEPVGALLGYLLLLPFLGPAVFGIVFGVIAGAMVYLSLDELLPVAKKYSTGHDTVYGMGLGMISIAISLVMFK